ncbi:hypothetical protein DACRYDRAFT_22122 [Dacryopinax primogenitus]|uniref:Uncharacterized protein n=1 Tax=Dacryopinax primogenitus (strain DJM 731) TaxID=1858805 RepID=M5FWY3_DACPD|nr:uncharacterized protein DACRYDRAFT_22122 [Dacryopinax primogenitus]EJU02501.1 hypothetical protein DACRYDRAFT_22122 [Dacryopinax primogenitus]
MVLSDEAEEPLVLPTTSYPPSSPRSKRRPTTNWFTTSRRRIVIYIGGAALVIFILHQAFGRRWTTSDPAWGMPPGPESAYGGPVVAGNQANPTDDCRPALGYPTIQEVTETWPLDRLQHMVDETKGYYARDYSLWLGWNNIRYIIEAGLLQAGLLNRTLIVPSFVYARQCEFGLDVCAAFVEMVNRGDAIGWDEWRQWPIEKQMGWKIPIGMMIDLNHLRETHAVVTMAEYLRLRGLSPDLEKGNGQWSDDTYKLHSRAIPNNRWDPSGVVRVEQQRSPFVLDESNPDSLAAFEARDRVKEKIEEMMQGHSQNVLDWEFVQQAIRSFGLDDDDIKIELFLRAGGFEVLHTYQGARGFDLIKSVVTPIKQVARMSEVHGIIDDFGSWTDEVVHLEGEVHLYRKPGNLRFTSVANLQFFTRTVLYNLRSLPEVSALADRVDQRMKERTDGRMWSAAHVRRGDFVTYGWTENSLEKHIEIVKKKLSRAPSVWNDIRNGQQAHTFDIPDAHLNPAMFEGQIPQNDDPFYIATDERDPAALDYIRSQGGVLIMDLLKPEDRNIVGWPLLITDILALAEQHVMARAAFFNGYAASSVAGGVLNLRAVNGWDPRTTNVE